MEEEEEPVSLDPDSPTSVEPHSSEPDKELVSPEVATEATASIMEEEPGPDWPATPPVWGLGGPGGDGSQPIPGPSPGTASGTSEDLRPPRRRPPPGKQVPCSSPGCFLSFPSVRDLAQHLRTHCPLTQSLEGKLFRCSALSCAESFPSMQELVAHSKLHHKPNRYFKSRRPAGHAAPSRIVWEHTRGRYSCMQCAFSTASRPAMTLHLEDHRPAAPAPGPPRPGGPAEPALFAPKVSPPRSSEGDSPVFLPL
ncbi:zinc finger protein 414 [Echinops telfairi]|uniref:Zinc finger protein 414 n=1 Tax=Echinops telfairi TaxID=9371 RepID=A0AC55D3B4_ECHTE|nr:zinc finger protein 414 [Echinops telfairi]